MIGILLSLVLGVQDPCSDQKWLDVVVDGAAGKSVGEVTVAEFERNALPFIGNDHGINSIKDTVTGEAALEIISDREMRAYGWCFAVNGVQPNKFPHQMLLENDDEVLWVFGFAHYKDGEWISNCTPTHMARPPYICH